MRNLPNPFWAFLFVLCACGLAGVAMFSHSANATSVITMASSIVTGAFGYIQGVRDARSPSATPPEPPAPVSPAQP